MDGKRVVLDRLPADAFYEHLPSGAAAREKLENFIGAALPPSFYFYKASLVGDLESPTGMHFVGCEFRQARAGQRRGRWVIPIPGSTQRVEVTTAEIATYERELLAERLRELRRLRALRRRAKPSHPRKAM